MSAGLKQRNIGEIAGATEGGKAAVLKIIHPPEPTPSAYQGYPDRNNTDSVQLHYTLNTAITAEDNIKGSVGSVLWLLPSILYPVLRQPNASVAGTEAKLMPMQENTQVDRFVLEKSVAQMRMVYRSTTIDNISPELYKSGMIHGGQFRGNVQVVDKFNSEILRRYANFDEFNQNMQLAAESSNDNFVLINNKKTVPKASWIDKLAGIQILKIGTLTTEGTQATMLSPKSQAYPAKDGVFMVTKPSQPELMYKSVNQSSSDGNIQVNNLYACAYEQVDPNGNINLYAMTTDGTGDPKKIIYDFPWFDHTIGLIVISGLDDNGRLFNLKTVFGFECAPLPGSTLNPLASPSAVPDSIALDWLAVFNHACPDMFPASWNAKGAKHQIAAVKKEGDDDTTAALDTIKEQSMPTTSLAAVQERPKPPQKRPPKKKQPTRGNTNGRPDRPAGHNQNSNRHRKTNSPPVKAARKQAKKVKQTSKREARQVETLVKLLKKIRT